MNFSFAAKILQHSSGSGIRRIVNRENCFSDIYFKGIQAFSKRLICCDSRELRIPTQYGHIAAKEYGNQKGHPVIAVHGWLENSGSFDLLLPHIVDKSNLHVVAFDETGCGLSSHLPPGEHYSEWTLVNDIKRVADHLQWKKFSLLAHSLGAVYAIAFASMFPEAVQYLIAIDAFGPFFSRENIPNFDAVVFKKDRNIKLTESNKKKLVYTKEDAVKKMMNANVFGINERSAGILLKRSTFQQKDGLVFNYDYKQKLRAKNLITSNAKMLELIKNIRCNLIIIMATKGPFAKFDTKEWFDNYKRHCQSFQFVTLDGNHHLHMESPELVASIINQFLFTSIIQ